MKETKLHTSQHLVCTNPFEWFEIHEDGSVFLCCPAWLRMPVGNLLNQSVGEIWNGPKAQMVRKSILNGSFHHCSHKRCPKLAQGTPPVCRESEIEPSAVRNAVASIQAKLSYGPRILNLCYDRSCNLACPTCRQDFHQAKKEERKRIETIARKLAVEAGESIEELKLSGAGDPFGSSTFRQMLTGLNHSDFPRLQKIHLHTNGQLWTPRNWAKMKAIHPMVKSAEISVDAATHETYAINRRGGSFNTLLQNFAFIQTLPIEVTISFVVQQNNYREIPLFTELAARYGFAVYFSRLVNWGTFTREEFQRRAIHHPKHPEHEELLRILEQVRTLPHVDLGAIL